MWGMLKILGKVRVNGLVDENEVSILFKHMKVKCPILSVRRLVHDGHEVYVNKNGGHIQNLPCLHDARAKSRTATEEAISCTRY